MRFGEKLKMFREERGWEREELAKLTGLSVDTIKSYELGYRKNPYPVIKLALASALKVKPSMLDDDREEETNGKADNPEARPR